MPVPGADEVLIKTECSLISSGTELTCLRGIFPQNSHWGAWVRYPWYPGYQNVGSVVALGSGVTNLRLGQRVASHSAHSRFVTAAARRCIVVPDGITSEDASWFALSAVAQIALERTLPAGLQRAAVIGLGPLGQLAVRWLRAASEAAVLPVGRSPWRVELALDGADPPNFQRAQLTIDASGNASALGEAFRMTEDGGTVALIGDPPDPGLQHLTSDLLRRNLTLVGCHFTYAPLEGPPGGPGCMTHAQLGEAFFRNLLDGRIDVRAMITHRLAPQEAGKAYELAASRRPGTLGILFDWG